MPKIKTRKAAAGRFRLTGSGKIRRNHANHGHIFTNKNRKRKVRLTKLGLVNHADAGRVRRMLVI
jgi:large subunit ribosomal protein L35